MSEQGQAKGRRRMAAVLAADAAGYSRLMGADEEATIAALNAARGVFRDAIARRIERLVDTAGDSVVEAVHCAQGVQATLAESAGRAVMCAGSLSMFVAEEGEC